jgi:hypothetical protein
MFLLRSVRDTHTLWDERRISNVKPGGAWSNHRDLKRHEGWKSIESKDVSIDQNVLSVPLSCGLVGWLLYVMGGEQRFVESIRCLHSSGYKEVCSCTCFSMWTALLWRGWVVKQTIVSVYRSWKFCGGWRFCFSLIWRSVPRLISCRPISSL